MRIRTALRRQAWYVIAILTLLLILLFAMWGRFVHQRTGYPKPPLPIEPHHQQWRCVWIEDALPWPRGSGSVWATVTSYQATEAENGYTLRFW